MATSHLAASILHSKTLAPLEEAALHSLDALGDVGRALRDLVAAAQRLTVVSGAGISTASGIPDYRSPDRPAYRPLQHNEFVTQFSTRRRYWARSMIGFGRMAGARPNGGHLSLAALQSAGVLSQLVTQNVDRLHQAAGSSNVCELHGTIHEVECLACGQWDVTRAALQQKLLADNAAWLQEWSPRALPRPDGDVELPGEAYASFTPPQCPLCGSDHVKPRVVFYGGSVPLATTERSLAMARSADVLLVVGSTLSTWSAYRLARATHGAGGRVAIVNFGPTRADDLACVKVAAHTSSALQALAADLGVPVPQAAPLQTPAISPGALR